MIIDCISDLHGYFPTLTGGDLLILAGDYTASDKIFQWANFFNWLKAQPYRKKIIIAGNHDNLLEKMYPKTEKEVEELAEIPEFLEMMDEEKEHFEYLCDSGTEFEGLKIWGTPWTKTFPGINPHCRAFTVDTDEQLADKFKLIPFDTDILITHSPSFGNYDITDRGESVGSLALWLMCLVVKPKLHVFGHIHEAYGESVHFNEIHLVNASYVNKQYKPVNKPIRIKI